MKDGGFAERYPRLLSAYRFLPNLKGLGPQNAIINRLHEMAAEAKQIQGESVEHKKPLSLSRKGKPTHVTFPLASRFVRHFRSVICVDVIDMIHSRHDRAVSGGIAFQFVRDQPSGFTALAFEQPAEKAFRRLLIPSALDEKINDIAVLVHGTPQIVAFPLDGHKNFVDVPGIPYGQKTHPALRHLKNSSFSIGMNFQKGQPSFISRTVAKRRLDRRYS